MVQLLDADEFPTWNKKRKETWERGKEFKSKHTKVDTLSCYAFLQPAENKKGIILDAVANERR